MAGGAGRPPDAGGADHLLRSASGMRVTLFAQRSERMRDPPQPWRRPVLGGSYAHLRYHAPCVSTPRLPTCCRWWTRVCPSPAGSSSCITQPDPVRGRVTGRQGISAPVNEFQLACSHEGSPSTLGVERFLGVRRVAHRGDPDPSRYSEQVTWLPSMAVPVAVVPVSQYVVPSMQSSSKESKIAGNVPSGSTIW